ncbi:RagB/SusD family nutrient uptake outer membrane protein [Chitinophaga alhagiae]|uniref:RagB/SusD family nutrient uptake outer membrane protein n=1 Tax=Chitinophaga alhagiae TaxID=2203219 RepID=UPI000E5B4455|nr:RagB/SusD family nutrient uptake outer membrane protein [Chitinophaga alhagiae]
MNKLKSIISFFVITALAAGCTKDFLERAPLDTISEPEFWKTANDLQLYVNNLYHNSWKNQYEMDNGSDNALSTNGASTWMNGLTQPTADATGSSYTHIRNVNIMIANMDRVTEADGDQYKGEAYFIRARHYFDILGNVGAAQLVTEPLKSTDERLYMLRTRRDSVADFILSDLDKAIALLKTKDQLKLSNEYQRINKDAAIAFKARIALFEGTWEKYHNGTPFGVPGGDYNKFLRIAAESAKLLMDNYGYTLDDDFQKVHNDHTIAGSQIPVKEIIFARQFSNLKFGGGGREIYGNPDINQWPHKVGYTRSAIRSFLCTDGLPISVSPLYEGDQSLANIGKNRDPRLDMSVFTPGEVYRISALGDTTRFVNPFTTVDAAGQYQPTGYTSQKFYTYDLESPTSNPKTWDMITVFFRYGEVLLIYAEAKAELGEFDQAVADITINKLRSRASVNMPPLMVGAIVADPEWPDHGYPLSPLLQEIRRERRVELLGEDFRFDDIRRWAAAKLIIGQNFQGAYFEPIMNNGSGRTIAKDDDNYFLPFKTQLPNGYQFDPGKNYLMPFPMNEIIINPALTKNPGW